ncbi:MAG: DEAD/DEAH box helicase, partial [Muribaculaceae bacterium]|nr:DEAD/DEAH box helicase [Muribaculaceae bacterium]
HRIGRTARADRDGNAITFISEKEIEKFKRIERFLGKEVQKGAIPQELGEGPAYVSKKSKAKTDRKKKYYPRNRKQHTKPKKEGHKPSVG